MSTGKTTFALLAGLAAGAALGILFAPAKGTETRRRILGIAGDLSDTASDILDEGLDKIRSSKGSILQLKGDWNVLKGKLKQQFSILTDIDLNYVEGKEEELLGRIQNKLGKTRNQVIDLINGLMKDKTTSAI